MKPKIPHIATITNSSNKFRIGQIIDLRAGKAIAFDSFIDQIASKDIIFIGEIHDNPEHHLIQSQILQAMIARDNPLTIGLEFFKREKQGIIDRYLNGELKESEFLEETAWKKEWGYDYLLYRPLILLAKQNNIPVLALNVPGDVVKKVARKGLESLTPGDRAKIANDIDLSNNAHRSYLLDIFKQHHHKDLKTFDYFYEAQCVWDETMAQNISLSFVNGNRKMIIFSGNGHIVNKFGIPDRTRRRTDASIATIIPYALNGPESLDKNVADYIWLTPSYPRRRSLFHN